MPRGSSSSVKVFFADKQAVISEIRNWAARLKAEHPEIQRIGFFGSYATDSYGPASDVDVVIVLKNSDRPFVDRIEKYLPENLSVGVDIFPYTEKEISRMQKERSPWISRILKEIVWF